MSQILKTGLKNKTRINYRTTVIFRLNLFLGFIRTPAQAKLTFQTRISGRSKKNCSSIKTTEYILTCQLCFGIIFKDTCTIRSGPLPGFTQNTISGKQRFSKHLKDAERKLNQITKYNCIKFKGSVLFLRNAVLSSKATRFERMPEGFYLHSAFIRAHYLSFIRRFLYL